MIKKWSFPGFIMKFKRKVRTRGRSGQIRGRQCTARLAFVSAKIVAQRAVVSGLDGFTHHKVRDIFKQKFGMSYSRAKQQPELAN